MIDTENGSKLIAINSVCQASVHMRKIHCLFLVSSLMYYILSLDGGNNDESSDLFIQAGALE